MIDLNKPLRTKGEKLPVTLYRKDAKGPYTLHGSASRGDFDLLYAWTEEGCIDKAYPSPLDLENVPEPEQVSTIWLNAYPDIPPVGHFDYYDAIRHMLSGCIGTVELRLVYQNGILLRVEAVKIVRPGEKP
jgi:hypothetical protein